MKYLETKSDLEESATEILSLKALKEKAFLNGVTLFIPSKYIAEDLDYTHLQIDNKTVLFIISCVTGGSNCMIVPYTGDNFKEDETIRIRHH